MMFRRRSAPSHVTVDLSAGALPVDLRLPSIIVQLDWAQKLTAVGSILSGLSVLGVGIGLYLTNSNNNATVKLTAQGQVSDRFTKSIEQLGSGQLDIRLGGIYGLERLMKDSPPDQATVVEVLSAFVREHGPRKPLPADLGPPSEYTWDLPPKLQVTARSVPPPTDLQAVLTVLSRQPAPASSPPDLSGANLTRANLTNANLARANLTGANLTNAALTNANLSRARLDSANMAPADWEVLVLE
jgi:hypothetical protein